MASRCCCRAPVGPGAFIGDSLTCGSEATPVFCPALLPQSLSVPFCTFHRPRQSAPPRRTPHWWDELRGMRAVVQFLRQSAEPCTAPPARFPRCSCVCGCALLAVLRSGPECCCPGTLEIRSVMCPICPPLEDTTTTGRPICPTLEDTVGMPKRLSSVQVVSVSVSVGVEGREGDRMKGYNKIDVLYHRTVHQLERNRDQLEPQLLK